MWPIEDEDDITVFNQISNFLIFIKPCMQICKVVENLWKNMLKRKIKHCKTQQNN